MQAFNSDSEPGLVQTRWNLDHLDQSSPGNAQGLKTGEMFVVDESFTWLTCLQSRSTETNA